MVLGRNKVAGIAGRWGPGLQGETARGKMRVSP